MLLQFKGFQISKSSGFSELLICFVGGRTSGIATCACAEGNSSWSVLSPSVSSSGSSEVLIWSGLLRKFRRSGVATLLSIPPTFERRCGTHTELSLSLRYYKSAQRPVLLEAGACWWSKASYYTVRYLFACVCMCVPAYVRICNIVRIYQSICAVRKRSKDLSSSTLT